MLKYFNMTTVIMSYDSDVDICLPTLYCGMWSVFVGVVCATGPCFVINFLYLLLSTDIGQYYVLMLANMLHWCSLKFFTVICQNAVMVNHLFHLCWPVLPTDVEWYCPLNVVDIIHWYWQILCRDFFNIMQWYSVK